MNVRTHSRIPTRRAGRLRPSRAKSRSVVVRVRADDDPAEFLNALEKIKRSKAAKWLILKPAYPSRKRKQTAAALVAKDAFEPDARSLAVLEGVRIAQEDLREAGGAYDLEQVRFLMHGVSRQAIDKRVQEGNLLAVPGPSNRRSYPALQFNQDGSVVEGLKVVRDALPTSNPWTFLNFLARPDDRLNGRKPIDVLKAGDIGLVVEAARRLGQQGE